MTSASVAGLAGVLLGLFVWRFWSGRYSVWASAWTPPEPGLARVDPVLAVTAAVVVCLALWAAAVWLLQAVRGLERGAALRRAALNFTPALGALALLAPEAWGGAYTIFSLAGFGVVAAAVLWLCLAPLIAAARPEWPGPRAARHALAAGIIAFFLLFGSLSVFKLYALHFGYRDSGMTAEALMNTLRGRFLYQNYYHACQLGDHVSPGLLLLLPVFALAPSAATLLLIQSAALALGAIPVYLMGRRSAGGRLAGLLLAGAWLLNPAVEHLNFAHVWGFHEITPAVPLLLAAFYAAWAGRTGLFFLFAALAMSFKEDVAAVVMMFGPFAFLSLKRRRLAVAAALVGAAWLFLALKVVAPAFWPEGRYRYFEMRWAHMGGSPAAVAVYGLTHPLEMARLALETPRAAFVVSLLAPLAFAPLAAPWALLAALPSLGLLVVSNEPRFYSIMSQTTGSILPALALAAAWAVRAESERHARRPGAARARWLARLGLCAPGAAAPAAACLAALVFCFALVFHFLLSPSPLSAAGPDVFDWYSTMPGPRTAALYRIKALFPRDASLAATDKAAVHFTAQRDLFLVDRASLEEPRSADMDGADWVLLDMETLEDLRHAVPARDRLLRRGTHGVVARDSGFLLLKKGAPIWRPAAATPAEAARMAFHPRTPNGAALRALGVDAAPLGGGRWRLRVLWRLERRVDEDLAPKLYFFKADGRQDQAGPLRPWDGAYPTYLWEPGAVHADELEVELPFELNPRDTLIATTEGEITYHD